MQSLQPGGLSHKNDLKIKSRTILPCTIYTEKGGAIFELHKVSMKSTLTT